METKKRSKTSIDPKLLEFLDQFEELEGDELFEVAEIVPVHSFKKGTILQEDGAVPRACYYVLDGLVREYRVKNGDELTVEFYDEDHGAISSTCFVQQKPSDSYLQCLEDSLLIVGTFDINEDNLEKYPVLKQIVAKMVESDLNERKDRFSDFVSSSPEERYKNLTEQRPDLFNRAPMHQIATYLGMRPETLSRIRRRIMEKDRD